MLLCDKTFIDQKHSYLNIRYFLCYENSADKVSLLGIFLPRSVTQGNKTIYIFFKPKLNI